jgi:cobalamin biosynthesis protein CbiG
MIPSMRAEFAVSLQRSIKTKSATTTVTEIRFKSILRDFALVLLSFLDELKVDLAPKRVDARDLDADGVA